MTENSKSIMPDSNRSLSSVPIYIFLFFLGFYLITTQGILFVADSRVNFQTVRSLVETNSLAIDCEIQPIFIDSSPSGKCYSKYDLGLAITAVPFYLLGRTVYGPAAPGVDTLSPSQLVTGTISQFITAVTCTLLYLLAVHLSKSPKRALDFIFLFGMCTLAWPYASQFLSQPLVGLLLLITVFTLIKTKAEPAYGKFAIAGLSLGWACFTRLDTLPLVLVIAAYAFYQLRQKSWTWPVIFRFMAILLLPVFAAIMAYLAHQFIRSGQWLQVGYEDEGWNTPFGVGLYGLLLSPGKGLVFYSPLAILALLGLRQLWQQGWQAEVTLIGGLFLVQLATYASWWAWDGGWTWGPRFLVSTQPLLILGLLPWLNRPRYRWVLLLFATVAYFVQIIGVATDPSAYLGATHFSYEQTLFLPTASPIWGQLQDLLDLRATLFIANQGYGLFSRSEVVIFGLICVCLMAYGGLKAARTIRAQEEIEA